MSSEEIKVDAEQNVAKSAGAVETLQGFTPGPWKAVGYSPGWWQIEGPEQEQIADVNYSNGLDEPTIYPEEANARLIAAAPQLFEALKEILNYGIEMDDSRLGYVCVQIDRDAIEDARAALALASKPVTKSAKRPISDRSSDGPASETK